MAKFQFEGAIDDMDKSQLDFIGEVLEKRGFKNSKVTIEPVGQAGDNYVANVKRIIACDENGTPFKIIAKVAPSNEIARQGLNSHNLFLNETIMYTEVLPKFKQLQLAAEVQEAEILKYAECYGCLTDPPYEMILLEDLIESNYTMLDRFKFLSEDCVKLLFKNIAILHSLSYVLKHKQPEKFDDIKSRLFDMWGNHGNTEEVEEYFTHLESQAMALVNDNDRRMEVLKKAEISKFSKLVTKIAKADAGAKHTVILQGDLWSNNIMFKFNGDTLQDLIMIDYQVAKECSPVFDILYLLFNCTDLEMRHKHLPEWLDYYHAELDKSLSNYGIKANYVYPRDKLDADLKRYTKYVFSVCVLVTSVIVLKTEEAAQLKKDMENTQPNGTIPDVLQNQETMKLFKLKVEGMIDTIIEFGLI